MRAALMVLCATLTVPVLAQEGAKPRDKKQSPRTEQAERRRPRPKQQPQAKQPRTQQPDRPAEKARPTQGAERRHPRPRPQTTPDARARHPRPEPDRLWRQRDWRWHRWQYDWWPQYRNEWYWFPYSYPRHPRFGIYFDLHLFGHRFGPHFRAQAWHRGEWIQFYWPFGDSPFLGCDWYWVPTHRTAVYDPVYDWRWKYWRWRQLYLCVD